MPPKPQTAVRLHPDILNPTSPNLYTNWWPTWTRKDLAVPTVQSLKPLFQPENRDGAFMTFAIKKDGTLWAWGWKADIYTGSRDAGFGPKSTWLRGIWARHRKGWTCNGCRVWPSEHTAFYPTMVVSSELKLPLLLKFTHTYLANFCVAAVQP